MPETKADTRTEILAAARRRFTDQGYERTPLREIEAVTGVDRSHLYRLLAHCLQPHEDGRVFGWRALVPYARVAEYCRIARIAPRRDGAGAAGAFAVLMQAHPALAAWITERVRDKRVTIRQVGTDEGLRMWCSEPLDERRLRFYAERFGPSVAPIAEEPFDHVLVTHGPAAVGNGREALRAAVAAPPWHHHG